MDRMLAQRNAELQAAGKVYGILSHDSWFLSGWDTAGELWRAPKRRRDLSAAQKVAQENTACAFQ
jgi:hypothetical protein